MKIFKIVMASAVFVFTTFAFANHGIKHKAKKSTPRKPSQIMTSDYVDEALQMPHNCRVVIHYVYHSETEKVEILPFRVNSEAECKETARLYRLVMDKKLKSKTVHHVWIHAEL